MHRPLHAWKPAWYTLDLRGRWRCAWRCEHCHLLTDNAGRHGRRKLPRCYDPARARQLSVVDLMDVNAYALDRWLIALRHHSEHKPCA